MNIGIIGSGVVGQTVGGKLTTLGHNALLGTRDPAKVQAWAVQTGANVGSVAEAATFGELIILATQWGPNGSATENAITLAGPERFAGKTVIDITNPLDFGPGGLTLAVGHTDSAGEMVQRWLPGAKVVKALNIVTAATMIDPTNAGGDPDMFIAGDDAGAKQAVTDLLKSFGWKGVIDLGGITGARMLEPLALLWCTIYFKTQKDTYAFKLVGQ